ncbi:hypothetical protein B0H10DRAFT_2117795 [Mycena sp. CBHHK59/15]|nr:hypothetical protein B0H10DRAFT_2117795 [Mycena sp. CBHHK59/15]
MQSVTFPKLPRELEREIFDVAAVFYPDIIPTLLRVAKRVREWTEPFLYNVVSLTRYAGRKPTHTYLESKGQLFLRNAVRHLCLELVDYPTILSTCSKTIDLSWRSCKYSPEVLPIISLMPLTRFHVDVHNLFADVPSIDIAQSPFLSVTHLTLFDDFTDVWTPVTWDPCDALAYLPALTHLCMWDSISSPVVHGVLKRCLNLRMLLNAWEDFEAFRPQEVCASLSVNDPRFVMIIVEDWVYEWELAAGTGRDIWTRGLDFIASKANGEIPASRFWVDDPHDSISGESDS